MRVFLFLSQFLGGIGGRKRANGDYINKILTGLLIVAVVCGLLIARSAQSNDEFLQEVQTETRTEGAGEIKDAPSEVDPPADGGDEKPGLASHNPETGELTKDIARALIIEYGWSEQWSCLDSLWTAESGWQAGRLNRSSLATGIPQALPGTKIYPNLAEMETEYRNGRLFLKNPDPAREIAWGLEYIKNRYQSPCKAWQAFQSRSPHWY